MVLSALILCAQQFLFISLISLAIIRAYITKILSSWRAAGLPPFIVFSLLGILSIYACIAIIRCCASQQVGADEECEKIDLEGGSSSLMSHGYRQVNHFYLAFLASHNLTYASRCACTTAALAKGSRKTDIRSMTVSNNIVSEWPWLDSRFLQL